MTNEKTVQVLLVEDNAGDVRLLHKMFSTDNADSFELTHFLRMSDAETHLAKGRVDIVLPEAPGRYRHLGQENATRRPANVRRGKGTILAGLFLPRSSPSCWKPASVETVLH